MTWVFRVGNQTLRITASNAAEALRRAKIVFPGQTISGVREGGQSGDANFRLINPSYIDAQNNPVYTAESTTGDPTGARAPEFTRDTFTTADPTMQQGPIDETLSVGDRSVLFPATLNEEAFGGIPAFQRGLRERGTPTGIGSGAFGRFLSGRFNPAAATFLGQTALDPSMGGGPEAFTNFVRNTGGLNLGQTAQDVFSGLLNLQRGGDVSAAPVEAQRFLNPTEFADFQLFGDLAGEAARGRLGGFAASQLLPSSADLANQFLAGPTSAQTGGFGQFLRERLGSVI
tara:strand:- start:253 stop:1113 length:861 start_codon:yes stop_codon:yes gene_type:complete